MPLSIPPADAEPTNNKIPYELKVIQEHLNTEEVFNIARLEYGKWNSCNFLLTLFAELSRLSTTNTNAVHILKHSLFAIAIAAYAAPTEDCQAMLKSTEFFSLIATTYRLAVTLRKQHLYPYRLPRDSDTFTMGKMALQSYEYWDKEVHIARAKRDAIASLPMFVIKHQHVLSQSTPHTPPHLAHDPFWGAVLPVHDILDDVTIAVIFNCMRVIDRIPGQEEDSAYHKFGQLPAATLDFSTYIARHATQATFDVTENLYQFTESNQSVTPNYSSDSDSEDEYQGNTSHVARTQHPPKFITNPRRGTINPSLLHRC
jgi:hypothetical protein